MLVANEKKEYCWRCRMRAIF